ncbi:MAG: methylmalonyl Co-A mutase-associated GTPase MeaB [Myxococcota bacterium]
MRRRRLTLDQYRHGVINGNRTVLARAITLIESSRPDDQELAQQLLAELLPHSGAATRVGVTGVPGVGKSTFIERFGMFLVERGHRLAVLAVDPTSQVSGGSILGDKSRMARLAQEDGAYIRPSPSASSLGGVARRTRETMILCEASGFDVVLVETVGVGQSETVVADMVDFFLLLMLPGGGDELQGIKRGIVELADVIAVNKSDGDNLVRAREAKRSYGAALRYLRPRSDRWRPQAAMISAKTGHGIESLWELIGEHRTALGAELDVRRRGQLERWMWSLIEEELLTTFRKHPAVQHALPYQRDAVLAGRTTATHAARSLLRSFGLDSEQLNP